MLTTGARNLATKSHNLVRREVVSAIRQECKRAHALHGDHALPFDNRVAHWRLMGKDVEATQKKSPSGPQGDATAPGPLSKSQGG
jgi:hypothetical protein